MKRVSSRTGRARLTRPATAAYLLLAVLSIWAITYELACTVAPGLADRPPFSGVWVDVPFLLGGLLLVARGLRGPRGWLLMGIGAVCWASGDVYWSLALSSLSSPPVPSPADAGYLLFCPFTLAGLFLLVRRGISGASRTLLLDALAAAFSTGALSAAFVLGTVLHHATGSTLAIATNLAYPINDLLLLGLLVGAAALRQWNISRTWLLLAAAIVSFWIADSLYLIADATSTYQQSAWFNPLWFFSPLLAAWAAWLPSRDAPQSAHVETSARGITMLLTFAGSALSLLVLGALHHITLPAIILAAASLLVVMARLLLTWRSNLDLLQTSRAEAITDALTGLRNRRALVADLDAAIRATARTGPVALVLFDLDGFKHYNDNFGHPAGDALLRRLGGSLAEYLAERGTAYRMGGDEFCALIPVEEDALEPVVSRAAAALTESGDGFRVGCSYGAVMLPREAGDGASALRVADQRMYTNKNGGRASASRQSGDVLVRALAERYPALGTHLRDVGELAGMLAEQMRLPEDEIELIRLAGELHDVGKVAIPDAILDKPARLDEQEWEFIRRHPLTGERIVTAAPALRRAGALIRSSHENWDGTGYPDRLRRGEIPLGSRIIAVCDAFDAMTTDRPYQRAMGQEGAIAELRRCAGSQFDPDVVEYLCATLGQAARPQFAPSLGLT